MSTILSVRDLKVYFELKKAMFQPARIAQAVHNVSFDLEQGEVLGIVGESGCGKSSLARALVGLNKIYAGEVSYKNINLSKASSAQMKELRRDIQFIFQDPIAALDPRMSVGEIIAEPLRELHPNYSKEKILEKVLEVMRLVGLMQNQLNRYPTEFSGGQCQRIGIARALIVSPKILICDESVSALDVSIKAQVINLLKDLKKKLGLSIIFISHDLNVIEYFCDRVLVMYLGNTMELSSKKDIISHPRHPYTKALFSANPSVNLAEVRTNKVELLPGELPSPLNPPKGCVFASRCSVVNEKCKLERPKLSHVENTLVACCFHY